MEGGLFELVAALIGGGVNAGLMISTLTAVPGASAGMLASILRYTSAGIFSYFAATIVYSILSPSHRLLDTPLIDSKSKASTTTVGTVVIGGIVNAAVFALISTQLTNGLTLWNWIAGVVAFFGIQILAWIGKAL